MSITREEIRIITGDFNTAHNEIDLANPKANERTPAFCRKKGFGSINT